MKTISILRSNFLCTAYHGGQWSALYQFASSNIYTVENHLRYLQEIESCLHPEYDLYPSILSGKSFKELNSLKNYFINEGLKNGITTIYGVHPVYGYNIPYVSEDTEQFMFNKITSLQYAI